MANNKKRSISVITTKVTVPASTATSSTLTASSGESSFTINTADAKFQKGAWIYDATNSELYKIAEMKSATKGTIVGTFNDNLSGATVAIIEAENAKVSKIYLATKDAVTIIDQVNVPADYTINDEVADQAQTDGAVFVEPYIVDANTNSSSVLAIVKKF